MPIEWNEAFEVHIAEIDAQHRKLLALLNALDEASGGKRNEVLAPLLHGLIEYAREHFDTEEKILERYAFPDLETHRAQHQLFVSRIVGFQTMHDMEIDPQILSSELLVFLEEWLKTHILTSDQGYASYLRRRGAGPETEQQGGGSA